MRTVRIGKFQVDRVVETEGAFAPIDFVLPKVNLAQVNSQRHWIRPRYLTEDNLLVMSFHSYVLTTAHHRILIDACVGNDKHRPTRPGWHQQQGKYLHNLAALGLAPEDIDFVCCTHLHADHVGWNTKMHNGQWVPTFPKARYVFARQEYTYWEQAHREALELAEPVPNHGSFADSVLPVMEANQAELVDENFEFEDGIHLSPAPGHTPGTCCLHARSQDAHGIFSGDILHTPVQLLDLSWSSRFCDDPLQSARTRHSMVTSVADTDTVIFAAHFPNPTAGRIATQDGGFVWKESA